MPDLSNLRSYLDNVPLPLVRFALIAVVTIMLLKFRNRIVARVSGLLTSRLPQGESPARIKTLSQLASDVLRFVVLIAGCLLLVGELGLDLTALLAAAGLGGVAIGFGAQSLVKDVISGLFILFEDSIRVGDVIEVAGVAGAVEEIRLRTLVLRDLAGSVHTIPNGTIEKVKNMSRDFSFYVVDMGVAYDSDLELVMRVLTETAAKLAEDPAFSSDILAPLEMLGIDAFGDNAVVVKCRLKTRPLQQWRVGRAFNLQIKHAFDAAGIEIPFPQRVIHVAGGQQLPAVAN